LLTYSGNNDCNLFTIAYAALLSYDGDPHTGSFQQSKISYVLSNLAAQHSSIYFQAYNYRKVEPILVVLTPLTLTAILLEMI